ncbi:hypothetical protein SAMN04488065_2792 [Haloplanus vescus]|uniref:Uncharacterized protein n=1 Tax=Haloplanus vescus TaxID=555874 RepID=A0A1H4AIS6_9EURY|nr:hypothetical protein [Haloplanus vescus]SEA35522.1 hypothetical protein SAMN04488065_2792 [Haloplanus vescus]
MGWHGSSLRVVAVAVYTALGKIDAHAAGTRVTVVRSRWTPE